MPPRMTTLGPDGIPGPDDTPATYRIVYLNLPPYDKRYDEAVFSGKIVTGTIAFLQRIENQNSLCRH